MEVVIPIVVKEVAAEVIVEDQEEVTKTAKEADFVEDEVDSRIVMEEAFEVDVEGPEVDSRIVTEAVSEVNPKMAVSFF